MVQLITQAPEAASGSGRVPGVGNVRPPVVDVSGLGNIAEDVLTTSNQNKTSRSLAGLAYDLLDPAAIDAELVEGGFGGLSEDQLGALYSAGTDAAKFKAVAEQRARSRSGSVKRLARQRQFIAENPLLVEEALTIYGNTTGEAPGKTLERLENDALGVELASLNPAAIYQQNVKDAAIEMGLPPTLPFNRLEQSVMTKRQVMSNAEVANAKWQTLDAELKTDEALSLDHFMTGTYPVFVDTMLREFASLQIPESSKDKEALIRQLEKDFTTVWAQYDQTVGVRGQANQAYTLAKANMRSFLDVKIAEINGETITEIEKNNNDRLNYAADNLFKTALIDARRKPLVAPNGQPVSGADLEVAIQQFANMDIGKLLELSISGIEFKDMIGQGLIQMGVEYDMGNIALREYSAQDADKMFNYAIATVRDAARKVGPATPEAAVNAMKGYFDNFNDAAYVPDEVKRTVLQGLADPEVAAFLFQHNYNLLDKTLFPMNDYATDAIKIFNKDLEDFESNVSVSQTDTASGPMVNVSFTPKSGRFGGTNAQTRTLRKTHALRIEALIRARMLWRGGTAQEALDDILSGMSGREYFNYSPQEEQPTE